MKKVKKIAGTLALAAGILTLSLGTIVTTPSDAAACEIKKITIKTGEPYLGIFCPGTDGICKIKVNCG